ncbi:hypothetical protein MPL1_04792 [Methylophaga lonarensis MPL]|uniref:Uncharacterized protein n=2 Tax=Methylophaga lonarensis MPL TaxID=1286106 RepID=M7P1S6_9GAMM|nr:hypothetical protein [Methylophaga lonarensis]EMR13446.1 hypothetical protein MPL1_04792 [Methylophaga lonarensis MPL]
MKSRFLWMFGIIAMLASPVYADETQVMVRVLAGDSKFIGTGVGGMRVVVEDVETGEILDQGWINGNTGDTPLLMENPIARGSRLTDDKTAGYLATLNINSPRLLRFTAIGPYGHRQSQQETSVTSWVVPGKHILDDGLILTLPGFIVDAWASVTENGQVEILAKASLMCGCPIKPDGLWDPANYEVKAMIMQDERKITEVDLAFTGPVGLFSAKLELPEPGHYKAIVYIFDADNANVGVDRAMFEITKP